MFGIALAQDRVHITGIQAQSLNGFGQQGATVFPMLLKVAAVLVGDHVQQVEPRAGKTGDIAEHANHFFHMPLAGVGDQQVAEHQCLELVAAAYGDQLSWAREWLGM